MTSFFWSHPTGPPRTLMSVEMVTRAVSPPAGSTVNVVTTSPAASLSTSTRPGSGSVIAARTSRIEKLEGERPRPQVLLLIEWPSREAALAFYESDEYRPYRQRRLAGARNELALVPGEDVTGTARMGD